MEIIDRTPANAQTRGGQITAPAHTLYEIVRKPPEGPEVELKWGRRGPAPGSGLGRPLALQPAGAARGRLPGDVDGGPDEPRLTLPTDDLIRLIDKTRFAISTEETRYYSTASTSTR